MQSKFRLVSIILFTVLSVFLMAFGALYASVQDLLSTLRPCQGARSKMSVHCISR